MSADSFVRPWASKEAIQRFKNRLDLAPEELLVLGDLLSTAKPVRRRQDIIVEGRQTRKVFLILDGLLIRYRITRDGNRQVLNVLMPGDAAGAPSCFFDVALYSIRTLTNAVVAAVSLDTLTALLNTRPKFAAKLFWLISCDAAICAEHVVVVGQRSARARIAHFLLEFHARLLMAGLAEDSAFPMPFSQDVLCDALGLSLGYLNRELRSLMDDGLIEITDKKVVINDLETLSDLADFERRYLRPSPTSELFRKGHPATPAPLRTKAVATEAAG